MALSFLKKTPPAGDQAAPEGKAPETQANATGAAFAKPASANQTAPSADKTKLSWMKRGAEAKKTIEEEEAKAALNKDRGAFRFWMPENSEKRITFLDGELDADGMLDVPVTHEHSIQIAGDWKQFICTSESEGFCPICEKADPKGGRNYMVAYLTVIDHSEYTVKSGKNEGKTYANQRKLYAIKKETLKKLTKQAQKRGGLTGCTFDVSRGGDKSASVGDNFEFVEKNTLSAIQAGLELKEEDVQPFDYAKAMSYKTAEELIKMGIGKSPTGPGYAQAGNKKSLADQL